MRDWLIQWWRLRGPWPAVYKLEAPGSWCCGSRSNPQAWELKAGGDGCLRWSKRAHLLFLCLFGPSADWSMLTRCGKGWSYLFSLQIQVLISSRKILTDTPRSNVLPAIWHPLAQSSGCIKLTITWGQWTEGGLAYMESWVLYRDLGALCLDL